MNDRTDDALQRAKEIYDRLVNEMRADLERRVRADPLPALRELAARRDATRDQR